jgi:pimeloyl-ACP methyl ester carboxylesterase
MSAPRPGVTRFASRQNARVAYDPGTPYVGDPALPTVVLLHDLLADRTAWTAVRDALADQYRVIIPDARGHGASPTLTNQWYSVAELAADVLAVLDAEELAAVHLVGQGLGGVTAFDLARRHPTRVSSLSLIAPALYAALDNHSDPTARTARTELRTSDRAAADAAYKGLTDKALDTYLLPRRGTDWRQTLTRPQLGAVRRHAAALSALLPALDAYTVDRAEVRTMDMKTLVLSPGEGSAIDRITMAYLADLLPRCRLTDLASSGKQEADATEGAGALAEALSAFFEATE